MAANTNAIARGQCEQILIIYQPLTIQIFDIACIIIPKVFLNFLW